MDVSEPVSIFTSKDEQRTTIEGFFVVERMFLMYSPRVLESTIALLIAQVVFLDGPFVVQLALVAHVK